VLKLGDRKVFTRCNTPYGIEYRFSWAQIFSDTDANARSTCVVNWDKHLEGKWAM